MKRGVVLGIGVGLLVLIGVIAIFAGRSSKKAPAIITLKVWSPFDEGKVYTTMAQTFLAANPNVRLEFKFIDAADAKEYEAKVVDAIASGTGPDIWLIRNDWLPKHEPKLVSSTGYVTWSTNKKISEKDALATKFTQAVVDQNSRGGKLYGVPLAIDSLVLYVNKKVVTQVRRELDDARDKRASIFDQYPTTWSELEQWSRLITKLDKGNIIRSGLALGNPANTYAATDVFTAMLQQRDGALFTDSEDQVALHLAITHQGQTTFPGQDALAFYSGFATPGNPDYSWNSSLGDPVQAFTSGKTAMLLAYSTVQRPLLEIDKNIGDSVTIRPFPQIDPLNVKTNRIDFSAYWTHVVTKDSPNPALAWKLLASFASSQNIRAYGKVTNKMVIDSSISPDKLSTSSSGFGDSSVFVGQTPFSKVNYKPEWQKTDEAIQDMLNQVISQKQSVKVAIDSAAEQLKKLLNP